MTKSSFRIRSACRKLPHHKQTLRVLEGCRHYQSMFKGDKSARDAVSPAFTRHDDWAAHPRWATFGPRSKTERMHFGQHTNTVWQREWARQDDVCVQALEFIWLDARTAPFRIERHGRSEIFL